jgi:hypothetical protein
VFYNIRQSLIKHFLNHVWNKTKTLKIIKMFFWVQSFISLNLWNLLLITYLIFFLSLLMTFSMTNCNQTHNGCVHNYLCRHREIHITCLASHSIHLDWLEYNCHTTRLHDSARRISHLLCQDHGRKLKMAFDYYTQSHNLYLGIKRQY